MEELENQTPGESPEPATGPVTEETPVREETPVNEEASAGAEPGLAGAPAEVLAEPGPLPETDEAAAAPEPSLSVDELMQLQPSEPPAAGATIEDVQLKAVLEAIVYVAEEPLTSAQISVSLHEPEQRIRALLEQLMAEFEAAGHGVCIREIAGGFKMTTKAEHHDAVRNFVKSLKPPLKLSLPALETLSVIAYKQPVTGPEIMEIRGVQGGGVLKTLLDRKLIAGAGRKNVIGKPILYKTTKEFLIQFGLKDLSELPSLKEFEEIRRMAFDGDAAAEPVVGASVEEPAEEAAPQEAAAEDIAAQEPPPPPVESAEAAATDEPAVVPEASQE